MSQAIKNNKIICSQCKKSVYWKKAIMTVAGLLVCPDCHKNEKRRNKQHDHQQNKR